MEWAEWLQARMDERGLVAYTLAMKASEKSGRRVHASSIQRQLSKERGIQHDLASAIAYALDLPEVTVFKAAGLLTEPIPGEDLDPADLALLRKWRRMTPAQKALTQDILEDILKRMDGVGRAQTRQSPGRGQGQKRAAIPRGRMALAK